MKQEADPGTTSNNIMKQEAEVAQRKKALTTQACQFEFSLWNLHFKRT